MQMVPAKIKAELISRMQVNLAEDLQHHKQAQPIYQMSNGMDNEYMSQRTDENNIQHSPFKARRQTEQISIADKRSSFVDKRRSEIRGAVDIGVAEAYKAGSRKTEHMKQSQKASSFKKSIRSPPVDEEEDAAKRSSCLGSLCASK